MMQVIKAAGLLGSAIKLAKKVSKLCVKLPQRSLSTDPTLFKTPGQGGYVTPGFDFEHPPFGHYYKMYCDVDVPTGDDDLPLWVDWSRIPGAVPPAYHQNGVGKLFYEGSVLHFHSLFYKHDNISARATSNTD
jgi:hypothetical protein